MKKVVISLVVSSLFTLTSAQESRNLFYAELGGAGPMGSFNYERQLSKDVPLLLRAGLGYVSAWSYSGITIPTGMYYLADLNKGNYLELGATYTFALNSQEAEGFGFFLPALGYRKFYGVKKGFFKITFSPVVFDNDPIQMVPWGGIAFGTRF